MIAASNVLLVIAITGALWGVGSGVMIAASLEKRGVKINWVLLRLYLVGRYVDQYRNVTRQESGRTGPLFYSFIIAMTLALATGIAGLVLRTM